MDIREEAGYSLSIIKKKTDMQCPRCGVITYHDKGWVCGIYSVMLRRDDTYPYFLGISMIVMHAHAPIQPPGYKRPVLAYS